MSKRHQICQTMTSDRSNNLNLKYQIFTPGCKDKGIRKLEFVTMTQFIFKGLGRDSAKLQIFVQTLCRGIDKKQGLNWNVKLDN